MADDPLDNQSDAQQNITELLSQFMSPEIANFASMIIKGSMGDVINSKMGGGGAYGPSTMFGGRRDSGVDMMDTFYRRSIEDTMRDSERALRQSMHDAKVTAGTITGASDPQRAATEFNLTNFATHLMMSTRQPKQMQAGAARMVREMGASSTIGLGQDSREAQIAINRNAGNLAARFTDDFMDAGNINDYYGFQGGDVGRALAELGRTGQFNSFDGTDASFAQQRQKVTGFLGSVSAASRFYDGSFMDVVDQMNATVGVNAFGTFGGNTEKMYMQMDAAGRSAMLSRPQMLSLAMQSAQVSRGMGLMDSTTALSAATESAVILKGAMGHGGRFVNEQRMRSGLVTMTTSAVNSEMAAMVSGAYVALDDKNKDAFMDEIISSGADSEGQIVGLARKYGFTGSGSTLMSISRGQDARTARAENFEITQAAMGARASNESKIRRQIVEAGGHGAVLANIDGVVTRDKLKVALNDFYGGDTDAAKAALGDYEGAFATRAKYLNMNAEELEGVMVGAERTNKTKLIREHINQRVKVDNEFKHLGKVSGIQGMLGFADAISKGKVATTGGAFRAFLGINDDMDLAKVLGAINPEDFGAKSAKFFKDAAESGDMTQIAGADVLGNVLQTHKLGGKELDDDEMRKYYKLATGNMSEAEAAKTLKELSQHSAVKKRKEIAQWSAEKRLLAGKDVSDISGYKDEAEELAMNEQFMTMLNKEGSREKLRKGGVSEAELGLAKGVATKLPAFLIKHGEKGMDMLEDQGMKKALDIKENELQAYDKVFGVAKQQDDLLKSFNSTDPMTEISETIGKILTAVQNLGE